MTFLELGTLHLFNLFSQFMSYFMSLLLAYSHVFNRYFFVDFVAMFCFRDKWYRIVVVMMIRARVSWKNTWSLSDDLRYYSTFCKH
jgi:hypothetical protein